MIVKLYPGIGDGLWVVQKLLGAGMKFDVQVAQDQPPRGVQIHELLPQVVRSVRYGCFSGHEVGQARVPQRFADIRDQGEVFLACNRHLEEGRRLEEFLPDLPTEFFPAYATEQQFGPIAERRCAQQPVVGFYPSSRETTRAWPFWQPPDWQRLARLLVDAGQRRLTIAVFGAEFDRPFVDQVADAVGECSSVIRVIGEPLGMVVEMLKRVRYFWAFPSGLGVIAASLRTPTMMFYPPHLRQMRGSWGHPESIRTHRLIEPMMATTPEQAFAVTAALWGIEGIVA